MPPTAAKAERISPSVKSCFNNRLRPAPIAMRTVISCRRSNDLTRSRLLTFAQAMRSTKITTARAISSVGCIAPALLNGVFHNGRSCTPWPRFVSG